MKPMLPAPSTRHHCPTFCVSPWVSIPAARPCSASAKLATFDAAPCLRHPPRPQQRCRATASTPPRTEPESTASAHSDRAATDDRGRREQLKGQLHAAAGSRNGLDRSEAQRQAIAALVADLESLNPSSEPAEVDLQGTHWRLLYSTGRGPSAGELGPLSGAVTQEFLETGVYVNRLDLLGGALRTSLRAEARPSRPDRLDLVFGDVQFQLGPLKFTQPTNGRKAFWRMTYVDDTLRLLYTNKGNLFILTKTE